MRVRPRSRMQMQKGNDIHRWTVSFADFMTLMFAVFVVLYAVAANDKEQYKEVMLSIQNASKLLNQSLLSSNMEGVLTHNSNSLIEDAGPALLSQRTPIQEKMHPSEIETLQQEIESPQQEDGLKQIKLALEKLFVTELDNHRIELDLNGDWLTIEMGGDILFAGGSHTLLNSSGDVVKKIAQVLAPVNNLLRIRGYSDHEIVANEIYRSNWELSGMRAFSVLHALSEQGIKEPRMIAEAYGRFSPILNDNNDVELLKSRRAVIAISASQLAVAKRNRKLPQDKSLQSDNKTQLNSISADSKEMREVYLPNDRLIITTRQE
ncbi:cell envelope biogenesis protein OmpA [Psychromonas marina]|uniref:Cell envelope biogenesis protein OmpA n=1 Tax=Psychromonas marina TaxID=88364 RepID=A0ABQ6DWJ9_9GAMM|nr:flagellar motor protein MotB [Psychromonas marina]GLS89442.1 cell envelope biogenesis protein OmpA [Psychromonas marina]